jgi:uncharacterized integral membrane protein
MQNELTEIIGIFFIVILLLFALILTEKITWYKRIVKYLKPRLKFWLILFAIVGYLLIPAGFSRIVEGLTSVEKLTEKCREEYKSTHRVGAWCKDGWRSSSAGSGTCSHHGGVRGHKGYFCQLGIC